MGFLQGTITVRLFHRLKEIVGEKLVRISPVPEGIKQMVNGFLERFPDSSVELQEEDGSFSHSYVVSVNERLLKRDEWDEMSLKDGDEVAFLTILSGG